MNPLLQKWVGTVVRAALLAYVAKYGLPFSEGDVGAAVDALMAFALVAWGLYEKWSSSRKQATTLAVMNELTGPGVPAIQQLDIEAVIKKGDAAPAMTPKDKAPLLDGPGEGMEQLKQSTARF